MDQEIEAVEKSPDPDSGIWLVVRFIIPPILIIVVGMPLYLLSLLIAGGGHGAKLPLALLFPFAIGLKNIGMVGIQLLVYGVVLGIANAKRTLGKTTRRLLLVHSAVVLINFIVWLVG